MFLLYLKYRKKGCIRSFLLSLFRIFHIFAYKKGVYEDKQYVSGTFLVF
ncbi:unknown [Prevotella sp. CAG:924]|nr:unknown [Prevotella sp. CAG:924]